MLRSSASVGEAGSMKRSIRLSRSGLPPSMRSNTSPGQAGTSGAPVSAPWRGHGLLLEELVERKIARELAQT